MGEGEEERGRQEEGCRWVVQQGGMMQQRGVEKCCRPGEWAVNLLASSGGREWEPLPFLTLAP